MNADTPVQYDVIVIGGALSGAATACLLLQENPKLKVVIIEKSCVFTRRVGEATVEVSTYFLMRSLGLTRYLNENHLVKNGLRFWFANDRTHSLEDCGEIGGRYLARVPAYLVDRATLDEEVLRRACALGAQLKRPATVQKVELEPGGAQRVTVRMGEETTQLQARWVVDASGFAALLARQNGWWRSNSAHPTTAVWSRWKGVKDFDDLQLARKFPDWAKECYGIRGSATNHLMGDGWWAWWIPLKGGDVSIGVTFDQRRVLWAEEGSLGQRLKDFLMRHPVGKEMMAEAQWTEGDVHWRKNLPYYSTTFVGDGFTLVGDAAGFIDPFYSPGMDWISYTAASSVELILAERSGQPLEDLLQKRNKTLCRSYERWFTGIYQDKYEYMGDFDIMRIAFLLDLGFYYLGVAAQPFKRGKTALLEPVFSTVPSIPFYHFMRFYNRRFVQMARRRRLRGVLGANNHQRRYLFGGYSFSKSSLWLLSKAVAGWVKLELTEGWRCWKTIPASAPVPGLKPIQPSLPIEPA